MGAWNKKRAMKRDNFIKTMNPLSQEDILAKFRKDTLPKADPEAVRIFTENTIAAFQEESAGCAIHLASFQSLFTLSPSQPHHLLIDKKGLQGWVPILVSD